jgi:isopentenyl-diphosphate delta-isomerase
LSRKTKKRKDDHIKISLKKNVNAKEITTGFEDIYFIHQALPECDRDKISLATTVFDHDFSAPIFIGAMTGGTEKAKKINAFIAKAIQELGLGMCVGSQRAAIEEPNLEKTYKIVRKNAPTAFLAANIGAAQLVQGYGAKEVARAVEMIEADALTIHLNPLQEAIQPEGETNFKGVLRKISQITETLQIPIIVKETGAGISHEVAEKLEQAGVSAIDVSGSGGTSWSAVEYYRAKSVIDRYHQRLGKSFWDWGIPTAVSLVEVSQSTNLIVIASGGIRTGIDVAKALALGANLTSMSSPILAPATISATEVINTIRFFIEELRTTMFLIGAKSVEEMKKSPMLLFGRTLEWLKKRGFKPEFYEGR